MLGGEKGSVAFHGDHRPTSIYVDEQVISKPAESTQEGTMLTFEKTYNDVAPVSVFGESTQDGTPTPDAPVPIVSRASACVDTSNADGSKTSTTDLTALIDGRELRSLPDGTRDEVQVRDNGDGTGDVVLVERVGVVTPTGYKTTDSALDGGAACKLAYTPDIDGMKTSNWGSGFCDMYANGNSTKTANVFRLGANDTTIYLYLTGFDSSDDASSYLEANKPTFYYALATPTETVLGTVPMPETFYDTTHVWEANGADISARVRVFADQTT